MDARVIVLVAIIIITDSTNIDAVYYLLTYRFDINRW